MLLSVSPNVALGASKSADISLGARPETGLQGKTCGSVEFLKALVFPRAASTC